MGVSPMIEFHGRDARATSCPRANSSVQYPDTSKERAMTLSPRCGLLLTLTLPAIAADITIDNRTSTSPRALSSKKNAATPLVNRPITADFDEQGRVPHTFPVNFISDRIITVI